MKIDGRQLASQILEDLKKRVEELKKEGIVPHLYVILLINDPSTLSYIKQKRLKSEEIGAKITIDDSNPNITSEQLLKKIENLNKDKSVHGIIVQRPLPKRFNNEEITNAIIKEKDVDGFRVDSLFGIPVGLAIIEILKKSHPDNFKYWLEQQNITVIGKGFTAGGPIIRTLNNLSITSNVISSKTTSPEEILKRSDIVISAVGKANIVKPENLKEGAILIGVGMHTENGKLKGDYEDEDIENKVLFYTPTPGGVGPVNVSCLMRNLVEACEKQTK